MKKGMSKKCSLNEQILNENLLKSFSMVFNSRDPYCLSLLLHDNGVFFEKMNKTMAEGYFCKLFMNPKGIGKYFDVEIIHAISADHIPGEIVLQFYCSKFKTDREINLGISADQKVYSFAFSFEDERIFSIRKPKRIVENIEEHQLNN
jgi:hypothetical protein